MTDRIRCCRITRRTATAVPIGLASAALLAACSADGTPNGGGETGAGGTGGESGGPVATIAAADVPVGGGVVLPAESVVVTQPESGVFEAFGAICTHQGCTVSRVDAKGIFCACHSSFFDPSTGAPTAGPASAPLPPLVVTVDGDQVVVTAP